MSPENYRLLNEKLSQVASERWGSSIKVRAFENFMFAGYDLCFGLLQFLSHKPKAAIVRSGSSLQDHLLPHFYRLQTPLVFKKDNENFIQFISQFDHEVNFVLWTSENEITGEVFLSDEQRMEIHKALSAKRIFSIEVRAHFTSQDAQLIHQSTYSVIIEAGTLFDKKQCIAFYTEKFKAPSLIGAYQNHLSDQLANENKINSDVLKFFGDSKLNYFNRYASKVATLDDRLVVFSKAVSGAALRAELELTPEQAFAPSELPGSVIDLIPAWWSEAKNQEVILGTLVIDLKTVNEELIKRLHQTHDKLTSQSTWSIS